MYDKTWSGISAKTSLASWTELKEVTDPFTRNLENGTNYNVVKEIKHIVQYIQL